MGLVVNDTDKSCIMIMKKRKNIVFLSLRTFAGKVVSLLFNMLSRLAITFLPRNKCLLISWLQSPPAVILKVLVLYF